MQGEIIVVSFKLAINTFLCLSSIFKIILFAHEEALWFTVVAMSKCTRTSTFFIYFNIVFQKNTLNTGSSQVVYNCDVPDLLCLGTFVACHRPLSLSPCFRSLEMVNSLIKWKNNIFTFTHPSQPLLTLQK